MLVVQTADGISYEVPLPCPVERIWPMHPEGAGAGLSGLILQRAAAGGERAVEHSATARADAPNSAWGPTSGEAGDAAGDLAHELGQCANLVRDGLAPHDSLLAVRVRALHSANTLHAHAPAR